MQISGLPVKLAARFQINLAMSDVRTMAHVDKFSHLTIPMLWFEIALYDLPERLEKRFDMYLNVLPIVEKTLLYGTIAIGMIFSIFVVTQVALRTSKSIATQSCNQNFNQNLVNNSVYNPCEEKLIDLQSRAASNKVMQVNELSKSEDENSVGDCPNVITRNQFELEDDDALSDIEYNEIDEESASTSSSEPVCKSFFFILITDGWGMFINYWLIKIKT